jgi:hypothetical protein
MENYQKEYNVPELKKRNTSLRFLNHTITLHSPCPEKIIDTHPLEVNNQRGIIALTDQREFYKLDIEKAAWIKLFSIPDSPIDWNELVVFHISRNGKFAAVVNQNGPHGIVFDLETGCITMLLDRKTYHNENCNFSIAFIEHNNRTLIIHATDWNRLDISDPKTGQLLTDRAPTQYKTGEPRPEHYLDYFHCGLLVSPNCKWIADDGWIWQPFGEIHVWNIAQWIERNVWESEDGPTKKAYYQRVSVWDYPICWIDDKYLAICGIDGEYSDELIPSIINVADVENGGSRILFSGPEEGNFVFDQHLFDFSKEIGMTIWDINTGERIFVDHSFCPDIYLAQSKQFLTLLKEDKILISRLIGY